MAERLQLATKLLSESSAEIVKLRNQRDSLLLVINRMQSTISSRLQQQRFDVSNVNKIFRDFHTQFQSLFNDVSSNFEAQTSNSAEVIKQLQYQNKCLRDQLTVRRLKYNVLNKSHASLLKKHTECAKKRKNLNTEKSPYHLTGGTVLRCIRCKIRKNIIDRLETDIADKIQENSTLTDTAEKLTAENKSLKESKIASRRELYEVRQKWKEEVDKLKSSKSEPETSSQCVEVGRTPGSQGGESPAAPADHSKCEKEIIQLQWSVSSKTAETVRLHNQLQQMKQENNGTLEEVTFYRNRSEHLMEATKELSSAYNQLQTSLNQMQVQLAECEQDRENLRSMLTNLVTSVSTVLSAE